MLGIVLVLSSPPKMKHVFDQSGLYQTLVSGILQQSQQQTFSLNDPIDTIPLNRPEVKSAIEASFPPQLLQQQTETVIDSVYSWLQGKATVPDFRIMLTTPKASFALAMGSYVQKRLGALPACSIATSPANFDAFNSVCLPSGLDVNGEVQKVELEVAGSPDFLPSTVITGNTFTGSSGKPLFVQLHTLPGYYQTLLNLPYVFAGLMLLTMIVELISNSEKRKAVHRLGSILIGVGVFFAATSWLFDSLFQRFTSSLNAQSSSGFFTQRFTQVADQADKAINWEYLILGVLCIIAGGLVWFIANALHLRFKPVTTTTFSSDHASEVRASKL
jgi:hypothetical protein